MGIKKKILREGDMSTYPSKGCEVECHYVLRLTNGKIVDSSVSRGTVSDFELLFIFFLDFRDFDGFETRFRAIWGVIYFVYTLHLQDSKFLIFSDCFSDSQHLGFGSQILDFSFKF